MLIYFTPLSINCDPGMKAVIYSRVSTSEQNPKSQLEEVLRYAAGKGYEVVRVFEENISGSVNPLERPVFREVLKYIRDNDIDVLLMYDMTRFYRPPPGRVSEALSLMRKIMNEYNVLIDFAREPVIEDPLLAELWKFLKSWVAAYERLQISLRTRYGLMRVKKEGKLYHKPSIVHYYAAWLFNKSVGDVTREELEAAKKQLLAIVKRYWDNPAIRKTKIAKILAENELRGMYQRFPNAPKSYITFYKLIRKSH